MQPVERTIQRSQRAALEPSRVGVEEAAPIGVGCSLRAERQQQRRQQQRSHGVYAEIARVEATGWLFLL